MNETLNQTPDAILPDATLKETLSALVALPPTTLPFVSAYVNLMPELEGTHQSERPGQDPPPLKSWRRHADDHERQYRPGITQIRDLLARRGELFPTRGPERDSFDADTHRILSYLDNGFDPASHGAAIFACFGEGIWKIVALPVPVETRLVIDRTPFVSSLAQIEDVYDRYALCLADSETARVYVVNMGKAEREAVVEGEEIHYTMIGALKQKRMQQRIENAVSEHLGEVAKRLEAMVFAEGIPWIVLSGDVTALTGLRNHLSERALERVVEMNHLDTKLPEQEAIARSLEAVLEAEQAQAGDMVQQARDGALSGGLGAAGLAEVTNALRQGAVDVLLLDNAFGTTGGRDGVDPTLLLDGNIRRKVMATTSDLQEELTTQALQTGARVEFVADNDDLDRMGGVAAVLRWHPADLPPMAAEPQG